MGRKPTNTSLAKGSTQLNYSLDQIFDARTAAALGSRTSTIRIVALAARALCNNTSRHLLSKQGDVGFMANNAAAGCTADDKNLELFGGLARPYIEGPKELYGLFLISF